MTGSAPLSECLCDQGVPENEGPFLRPVLGYATQSFLLLCMFHPGPILRGGYVFSGIYLQRFSGHMSRNFQGETKTLKKRHKHPLTELQV